MYNELFRKYLDIINEAETDIVSQQDLMTLYQQKNPKPTGYMKVAVEAVFPKNSELAKKLETGLIGKLDATNYKEDQPYVVIQGNKKTVVDIYTNSKGTLDQKLPYNTPDALLTAALESLGISLQDIKKAGGGLFIKKAITYMIPARDLGVENRTIDAGWGTQQVQQGGFLVLEGYPNTKKIYCVNPDQDGLPIGYIKAKTQA